MSRERDHLIWRAWWWLSEGGTVRDRCANVLLIVALLAFTILMIYRAGEVHRYLAHYPK